MRRSGILMHITSLPSPYGIGTLGKSAYDFVDFLKSSYQTYWQVLPIGPTSFGDSPYQTFSSRAGNPYFIDLDVLMEEGLLTKEDLLNLPVVEDPTKVDYGKIYESRFPVLKKAYQSFLLNKKEDFDTFKEEEKSWLNDYCLFMAIKDSKNGCSWDLWEPGLKRRHKKDLMEKSIELKDSIDFYAFLQYEFFRQWMKLKKYANENGVEIIGDIPIYVAFDSADVWSHPELFMLDRTLAPKQVAGCPPDAFSEDGQLWGNPIYNWKNMENKGYDWWIERVKSSSMIYDITRIDHFRGFEAYWSIPAGDTTAKNGKWVKGPGYALFERIKNVLGDVNIIAEDLGYLTPEVHALLKECGYPGMKILQFGFDPDHDSDYASYHCVENTICYTGTHDNDTTKSWFKTLDPKRLSYAKEYLGVWDEDKDGTFALIRLAFSTASNTVIIPMQDYLELTNEEGRMNRPSTREANWTWRMKENAVNDTIVQRLRFLSGVYKRNGF